MHRLPIARAIGCALRLAPHPGNTLVQLQKDFEQVLRQRSTDWEAGKYREALERLTA